MWWIDPPPVGRFSQKKGLDFWPTIGRGAVRRSDFELYRGWLYWYLMAFYSGVRPLSNRRAQVVGRCGWEKGGARSGLCGDFTVFWGGSGLTQSDRSFFSSVHKRRGVTDCRRHKSGDIEDIGGETRSGILDVHEGFNQGARLASVAARDGQSDPPGTLRSSEATQGCYYFSTALRRRASNAGNELLL